MAASLDLREATTKYLVKPPKLLRVFNTSPWRVARYTPSAMWFFCCDAIKTNLDAVRARPPGGRCLTGAENTVAAASEPPLAVAEVVEDEETPKRLASSLMRVKGKVRVFRPRTCIISQPLTRFRNNRMGVK